MGRRGQGLRHFLLQFRFPRLRDERADEERPGKTFNYDSGSIHVLSAALRRRTSLDPIASRHSSGRRTASAWPSGAGAQDEALRHGQDRLSLLARGAWAGRQIVSKAWVDSATRTQVEEPGSADGFHYGYLWWICPSLKGYAAIFTLIQMYILPASTGTASTVEQIAAFPLPWPV